MSSTATPAGHRSTTWSIDPAHSHVEFAVKHLMISTVKGRFGVVSGSVTTDEADPAKGAGRDRDRRRQHRYPRGAARRAPALGGLLRRGAVPEDHVPQHARRGRRGDRFKLIGDLTIHGVTREVALDVTSEGRGKDPWGGERAGFSATTKIKRSEFGLTWNQVLETGGFVVGDEISIALDVELVKQ